MAINVEDGTKNSRASDGTPSASRSELTYTMLKLVLSQEGHALRRVLLEAVSPGYPKLVSHLDVSTSKVA